MEAYTSKELSMNDSNRQFESSGRFAARLIGWAVGFEIAFMAVLLFIVIKALAAG